MKIKVGTLMRMIGAIGMEKKIQAAELVRDECDVGLKEAKQFVDMFCKSELAEGRYVVEINNDTTLEIGVPSVDPKVVVDEDLIFDADLAAEWPIEIPFFDDAEKEAIVQWVIEAVLASVKKYTRSAIKRALLERFKVLPSSVRDLTLEVLSENFVI